MEQEVEIEDLLEGKSSLPLKEAYTRLLDIAEDNGSRDYLQAVYVDSSGFVVATNGYVLTIIPIEEDIEKDVVLPVVDKHKRDEVVIDLGSETLEVKCDHKTDKSGKYEFNDTDSFPDYRAAMDRDFYQQTCPNIAFDGNYAQMVGEALSAEKNKIVVRPHEKDSPISVEGEHGYGIIMPIRMEGNTDFSVLKNL